VPDVGDLAWLQIGRGRDRDGGAAAADDRDLLGTQRHGAGARHDGDLDRRRHVQGRDDRPKVALVVAGDVHVDGAPAHRGDGVGGTDLDGFAGADQPLGDAERELPDLQFDRGLSGLFGHREAGELPDRDDRFPAEEQPDDGVLPGVDTVADEHVVLELQGQRAGRGRAVHRALALNGGDDTRLGGLGESRRSRDQD
jgi:hypothetical protein